MRVGRSSRNCRTAAAPRKKLPKPEVLASAAGRKTWPARWWKKAGKEERTIVFIDESGLSQKPHRCRTRTLGAARRYTACRSSTRLGKPCRGLIDARLTLATTVTSSSDPVHRSPTWRYNLLPKGTLAGFTRQSSSELSQRLILLRTEAMPAHGSTPFPGVQIQFFDRKKLATLSLRTQCAGVETKRKLEYIPGRTASSRL